MQKNVLYSQNIMLQDPLIVCALSCMNEVRHITGILIDQLFSYCHDFNDYRRGLNV
jgi:hypothetical protein